MKSIICNFSFIKFNVWTFLNIIAFLFLFSNFVSGVSDSPVSSENSNTNSVHSQHNTQNIPKNTVYPKPPSIELQPSSTRNPLELITKQPSLDECRSTQASSSFTSIDLNSMELDNVIPAPTSNAVMPATIRTSRMPDHPFLIFHYLLPPPWGDRATRVFAHLAKAETIALYSSQISRLGHTNFETGMDWIDGLTIGIKAITDILKLEIFKGLLDEYLETIAYKLVCNHDFLQKYFMLPLLKSSVGTIFIHIPVSIGLKAMNVYLRDANTPIFEPEYVAGWFVEIPGHLMFGVWPEMLITFLELYSWNHITKPLFQKHPDYQLSIALTQTTLWFLIHYGITRISDTFHHWMIKVPIASPENPTRNARNYCRSQDDLWFGLKHPFLFTCKENEIILGTEDVWLFNEQVPIQLLKQYDESKNHFHGTIHQFILYRKFFGEIVLPWGINENTTKAHIIYDGLGKYQILYK